MNEKMPVKDALKMALRGDIAAMLMSPEGCLSRTLLQKCYCLIKLAIN